MYSYNTKLLPCQLKLCCSTNTMRQYTIPSLQMYFSDTHFHFHQRNRLQQLIFYFYIYFRLDWKQIMNAGAFYTEWFIKAAVRLITHLFLRLNFFLHLFFIDADRLWSGVIWSKLWASPSRLVTPLTEIPPGIPPPPSLPAAEASVTAEILLPSFFGVFVLLPLHP